MQNLIIYIIFFHLIFNVNCQYAPVGRSLHTSALIGTRIYTLGGTRSRINKEEPKLLNDFFYLDISKSFDKTKGPLPFVDLSDKSLEIPPHSGAAASVFGDLKDGIFLFGGDMGKLNDQTRLTYSFNATQLQWRSVTVSQGAIPDRKIVVGAVTDNNDKIYIFGGGIVNNPSKGYYSNGMNIFDARNKIWSNGPDGTTIRDGHTATFLPDTGEIIYIGGYSINLSLVDITNLDVYNTVSNTWSKVTTKNPPEQRYGHSAVLTNDKRIVVFGGTQSDIEKPVNNRYVVLDVKTFEWYHGTEDPSIRAPFRHHTATLYNDYMFISFGFVLSVDNPTSDDVFIYKIGDYANVTEVNSFINENNVDPNTNPSTTPVSTTTNNHNVIIGATIGSVLVIIILGIAGFIIFKRYRRSRHRIIKTP